MTYVYPSGIRAVGTRKVGADVVEWGWRIENAVSSPSLCVTAFFPLYLTLQCQGCHAPVLHGSRGGLNEANFPPVSWTQWSRSVVTERLPDLMWRASSLGGRSSNSDLPFFVLETADLAGGWFLGMGWSGDWHLQMERYAEKVTVRAGMTNLALCLEPGESFLKPSLLLGRYRGDAAAGGRRPALLPILLDGGRQRFDPTCGSRARSFRPPQRPCDSRPPVAFFMPPTFHAATAHLTFIEKYL